VRDEFHRLGAEFAVAGRYERPLDERPFDGGPLDEGPFDGGPLDEEPFDGWPLNEGSFDGRTLDERPFNGRPLDERRFPRAALTRGTSRACPNACGLGRGPFVRITGQAALVPPGANSTRPKFEEPSQSVDTGLDARFAQPSEDLTCATGRVVIF